MLTWMTHSRLFENVTPHLQRRFFILEGELAMFIIRLISGGRQCEKGLKMRVLSMQQNQSKSRFCGLVSSEKRPRFLNDKMKYGDNMEQWNCSSSYMRVIDRTSHEPQQPLRALANQNATTQLHQL